MDDIHVMVFVRFDAMPIIDENVSIEWCGDKSALFIMPISYYNITRILLIDKIKTPVKEIQLINKKRNV